MRRLLHRRSVRIALPVVLALAIAGGAFAYFTSSGSGSGAASAGTAEPVTLSPATPTTQLYPGGSADVKLTAANPNSFRVRLPSLQLDTSQGTGGLAVDADHSSCALSALHFTTQSNGDAGWDVPPKVGSTNGSLPIDLSSAISMDADAANACQGATFTVYLKVGS